MIAEKGYDVGFGAKKHFATYDIISKFPGMIGFFTISCGILSLAKPHLFSSFISAIIIILGVLNLYISLYNKNKEKYREQGDYLLKINSELKSLYFTVKNLHDNDNFDYYLDKLRFLSNKAFENSISDQALFSNWYAHYKFFWEQQIGWIQEKITFKLFRDKIPLSFMLSIAFIFLFLIKAY